MAERRDTQIQRATFNALADNGVYGEGFTHSVAVRALFEHVMTCCLLRQTEHTKINILDCGCGNGYWLRETQWLAMKQGRPCGLHGFDLSEKMLDLARRDLNLQGARLQTGELSDAAAYQFSGMSESFHVIYAFDAIQQLPAGMQYDCCLLMLSYLRPGGELVIFDHERRSRYGRSMARKKFVTRYLGVPLVPSYYCNARYPSLGLFAQRLSESDKYWSTIVTVPDTPKVALIIQRRRAF
jgi:SAM-dependent methyltransferase